MSNLRLPNGDWTTDVDLFSAEWDEIRKPLEDLGFRVIGFDPGILMCDSNAPSQPFNLPLGAANKIIKTIQAMQARIDELMLEYCPDEMTKEQMATWAKHQVPVEEPGLKVEREPGNAGSEWPLENCCMCRTPTPYWYGTGENNVALCPSCAEKHKASDLPTKAQWIAKERKLNPPPFWRAI